MGILKMSVLKIKKQMRENIKNIKVQINASLCELLNAMLVMLLQTLMDGGLTQVQPAILQRLKII